ncbi:MAG: hypothetical protein GEV28_12940 [Actinophytocola sp.]|uniref:SGNH/GDSL hydrolase family protein n=1 Tax=Actinophytocola sp. TaxID=1872138 RepID=UPI001322F275|nr:SGNH/GDSL hydrolase family protein [Actinophytocola sp.]MPZ81246.1 hypothetical protein [Actinophytocola sp.]
MLKRLLLVLAAASLTTVTVAAAADSTTTSAQNDTWCTDRDSIVVLGDSLSTGHGASDPANAWVRRTQAALPDTDVTNLSADGALTSDFLPAGVGVQRRPAGNLVPTAVSRIQTIQPSLVIIEVGANEYGTDRDPVTTYRANLTNLTDRIQAASPDSTLLYMHTTGFDYRWATPPIDHAWTAYDAAMTTVATTESAPYLDLTEFLPWADTDTAGLYVENEFGAGNTVHWADAGHVATAGVIQQQLLMCG